MSWLKQNHELFRADPLFGPLVLVLLGGVLAVSPLGGVGIDSIKYGLLILAAGVVLWRLASYQGVLDKQIFKALGALGLFIFCSFLLSSDKVLAGFGFNQRLNSSLVLWLCLGTVFVACVNLTVDGRKKILDWYLLCAFVISGLAVAQSFGVGYYTGIASFFQVIPDRVGGLLGNPNFSSLAVAAAVPALFYRYFSNSTVSGRLMLVVVGFTYFWSLAVFSSRGAILALVVGLLPLLWSMARTKKYVWLGSTLVVLAIFFGVFFQTTLFLRSPAENLLLRVNGNTSDELRLLALKTAGDAFLDNPWFGVGPSHFVVYYTNHWPSTVLADNYYFDDPHNWLLYFLSSYGLFFTLLFLVFLVWIGLRALQPIANRLSEAAAIFGAVLVILFGGFFNPLSGALYVVLVLFSALLYDHTKSSNHEYKLPVIVGKVFRLVSIVLMVVGVMFITSDHLLVLSQQALQRGDFARVETYSRLAFKLSPVNRRAHMLYVYALIREKKSQLAERELEVATKQEPWSFLALLTTGKLYTHLYEVTGDNRFLSLSEYYLRKAQSQFPTLTSTNYELALLLFKTNRADEGVLYLRSAITKNPNIADSWMLYAKYYLDKGQASQAIFALRQATFSNPYLKSAKEMVRELKKTDDLSRVFVQYVPDNPLKYLQ